MDMSDQELKKAQQEDRQLEARLRSIIQKKAKLQKMVELRRRLVTADLPDWIGADFLDAMVEAESDQAATREAKLLGKMSTQQVIEHAQQQNTPRQRPRRC